MPDATGDLFGIWRTLMQQWETQANAALTDVTGQESFSREMNRTMAGSLQMQAAFNEAVEKALALFNMPSRDDVARLSDQLAAIERKLDALAEGRPADLNAASAAPRPRTRRPPGEKTS